MRKILILLLLFSLQGQAQSSQARDSWMGDMNGLIGSRLLQEISFPGSHDAGMNKNDIHGCIAANHCNTATQYGNILDQLNYGSRYFDIRPSLIDASTFDGTQWSTGHTSVELKHQLGCRGEGRGNIRDALYTFFSNTDHNKELVILKLSHCGMGPGGNDDTCTEQQRRYVSASLDIDHRLIKCEGCDLKSMTLNDLLKRGNILLLVDGVSDTKKGLFSVGSGCGDDYLLYDSYSNSNDFDTMRDDQYYKMSNSDNHRKSCNGTEYAVNFLLSWTLTLSTTQVLECEGSSSYAIIDLSQDATSTIVSYIQQWVASNKITKQYFPNILYTDAVQGEATDAAIYLNTHYDTLD